MKLLGLFRARGSSSILGPSRGFSHQGKVVYVGSSNFAGWDIATSCQEASTRGLMGLVSEQSIYDVNNRMLELEVIPACRHYGLGLIPWSPLGGGLLGGALEKLPSGRRASEESLKEIKSEPVQAGTL